MSSSELLEKAYSDLFLVFVKGEVHAASKLKVDRQRIIWGAYPRNILNKAYVDELAVTGAFVSIEHGLPLLTIWLRDELPGPYRRVPSARRVNHDVRC